MLFPAPLPLLVPCGFLGRTSLWTLHRSLKEGVVKSFRAGGGRKIVISSDELFRFLTEEGVIANDLRSKLNSVILDLISPS